MDGDGVPQGLREEAISVAARVARLSVDATALRGIGSSEVVRMIRARAGVTLDPSLVRTLAAHASTILADVDDPRATLLDEEPEPVVERPASDLQVIAGTFGHLADLKFPALHGHSAGVAALAVDAARRLRLDGRTCGEREVAALLHDIGRLAITNQVWEKPGALTSAEWEQVRLHSYFAERILATSQELAPLATIVGMHHERLDGSGYHRGAPARDQAVAVRVLAAADVYHAMTQDRPHRPRRPADEAAAELARQARAGILDAECVGAVLESVGHTPPRSRDLRPAGLTDRELEVLRLVAAGHSNPEIADRLVISRRTAEHHVQHIYRKVGVSSRPALALFAMEHELL